MCRNCLQEKYSNQRRRTGCLRGKNGSLDPNKNEIYKFLGCEQADKIDAKRVMERVKKEIRKRLDHLNGDPVYTRQIYSDKFQNLVNICPY